MKLLFSMPHLMEVRAITTPWERSVTGAEMVSLAKWADKLGYAMISVPEHNVIPREHLDLSGAFHLASYPSMAFFAGATERIRINSCISILPLQNPIVAAKTLSTMDFLSSGRVTATFGAGWLKGEFEALGVDFHQRGAMMEEYVQAIIELWTKEEPEFEGRYVKFRDVAFEPKCLQKPHLPIWFGGDAEPVLKRVARYASGWHPFLTKLEDFPARIDFIKSQPDYTGKLEDIYVGFGVTRLGEGHVATGDESGRPGQSRQQILDRLGWFKDLGVTMSSVPIPPVRGIQEYYDYSQWVAEDIMPAVA
jgi:probable F420-dependent oxidoreductase